MAKQKKKRNKAYTGADAAVTRPVITRISAANRSRFGQWWFDNKRVLKPVLITSGIVLALIIIIVELVRIFSGS
jgi:hypothetical protein